MVKVTIVGCGNLGQAIARGLCSVEGFNPKNLSLSRRNLKDLQPFLELGVTLTDNNINAVIDADIVLLALKPYNIKTVVAEIQEVLTPNQKLVSLASGLSLNELSGMVTKELSLYRAMPNTATTVNKGLTAISSLSQIDQENDEVVKLFKGLGEVLLLEEQLLEAVTILGACGIAYVMRFMRAMEQGGIQIGFDAKTAAKIVQHTVEGAAKLLIENGTHPEQEIDKVTTPKGCTIVGLNEMEHSGFSSSLIKGIVKSYEALN